MKMSLSDKAIVLAKKQGYTADRYGAVFRPDGKELLGSKLNTSDHLRVTLYVQGLNSRGHASVLKHRFISYFFYGEEVFRHDTVRHKNDLGSDNRLENLALGSFKENRADIPKEIISANAKKHAYKLVERSRKLSDEDVTEIRKLRFENEMPYYKIADMFDISTMTAYRAANHQSWRDL